MKPRFEPKNVNFDALMKEALELENRLIEKASPNYTQKEGSMQGQERFMTVTGGGKPNVQSTALSTLDSHFNQAGGEGPVMKSVGGSIERIQVQDLKKSVDRLARRLE